MTDQEYQRIIKVMRMFALDTRVEIDFYLRENNSCDLKEQSYDTVFFRLQSIILKLINQTSLL